jgi:hypothetical protein
VDRTFGALPPLADRIGSVVARFSNLLRAYRSGHDEPLGRSLFETYPADSLRLLGWPHKGYKEKDNRTTFRDGQWIGRGPKGERLAEIASRLGLIAEPGTELTGVLDDECLLRDGNLEHVISESLGNQRVNSAPPRGYVLLKEYPRELEIRLEKRTVRTQSEMLEAVRR